jgi:hypothetical protein
VLATASVDQGEFPPAGLLLIMMAIPTTVVLEHAMGMTTGHEQALALVERYLSRMRDAPLRRLDQTKSAAPSSKKSTKKPTKAKHATQSTQAIASKKPVRRPSPDVAPPRRGR